jgi:hypothetical protein
MKGEFTYIQVSRQPDLELPYLQYLLVLAWKIAHLESPLNLMYKAELASPHIWHERRHGYSHDCGPFVEHG